MCRPTLIGSLEMSACTQISRRNCTTLFAIVELIGGLANCGARDSLESCVFRFHHDVGESALARGQMGAACIGEHESAAYSIEQFCPQVRLELSGLASAHGKPRHSSPSIASD